MLKADVRRSIKLASFVCQ